MPMFIVILNYNSEEHFCFQANWFFFSNIKKKKSLGIEVAWVFLKLYLHNFNERQKYQV